MLPISIRFSISPLPVDPMQPRRSDERVGYFNTVYKDLGDHRAVDATRRSTDLLNTQVQYNVHVLCFAEQGNFLVPCVRLRILYAMVYGFGNTKVFTVVGRAAV